MDIFSAFSSLQGSIRTYFICFLLIVPFWYLDIVLFSKAFYSTQPIYIHLLVAFCIAICWIWMLILVLVNAKLTDNYYKTMETKVENFILYWVTIVSIPILGFITFILTYFEAITFKEVLTIKFTITTVLSLIAIIVIRVIRSKTKKEPETQSS